MKTNLNKLSCITIILAIIVMLVFSACKPKMSSSAELTASREESAVMITQGVTTLISDSGITRYRAMADEWHVYDKTEMPYWDFPKGLYLEQFDQDFQVHSTLTAGSAIYYVDEQKWIMKDSVKARNVKEEYFETELLYVEQTIDKIHTDKPIKITQKDKIIYGVGFNSNQRLTRYVILNPQGTIPLNDSSEETSQNTVIEDNTFSIGEENEMDESIFE